MGRDGATFWDKGTEVPSLSRYKGTKRQAQNLATERDGPGQPIKIWDGMRDGTEQSLFFPYDFLFLNIFSCFRAYFFCCRTSFPVLEYPFPVIERPFHFLGKVIN